MAKAGIKINTLSAGGARGFVTKAAPVYDYFIKKGLADPRRDRGVQNAK